MLNICSFVACAARSAQKNTISVEVIFTKTFPILSPQSAREMIKYKGRWSYISITIEQTLILNSSIVTGLQDFGFHALFTIRYWKQGSLC